MGAASPGKEAAETISHLLCDKENLSFNDANKLDMFEPPKVKRMRFSPENNNLRSKPRVLNKLDFILILLLFSIETSL